jgi:hypothetical protein
VAAVPSGPNWTPPPTIPFKKQNSLEYSSDSMYAFSRPVEVYKILNEAYKYFPEYI